MEFSQKSPFDWYTGDTLTATRQSPRSGMSETDSDSSIVRERKEIQTTRSPNPSPSPYGFDANYFMPNASPTLDYKYGSSSYPWSAVSSVQRSTWPQRLGIAVFSTFAIAGYLLSEKPDFLHEKQDQDVIDAKLSTSTIRNICIAVFLTILFGDSAWNVLKTLFRGQDIDS